MKKENQETSDKSCQNPKQKKESTKKNENTTTIRKIPQTLIQSYDFVMIHDEKKSRLKRKQISEDDVDNDKFLKMLPILQGKCQFQYYGNDKKQTNDYEIMGDILSIKDTVTVNIKSITKAKLIGVHGDDKKRKIKINFNHLQDEKIFLIHTESIEELFFIFAGIVVRKLILQNFLINEIAEKKYENFNEAPQSYQGEIYKMSGYMGYKTKWEKRKMVIEEILKSFKDEKCTFSIKSAKQLWTRFEMYNGHFIIKIRHGIEKVQLGIPLVDFSNVSNKKNWLLPLTKLIE